jgi:hypothetical protein
MSRKIQKTKEDWRMNYFYVLVGTIYAVALVVQMLGYAASIKETKVEVVKVAHKPSMMTSQKIHLNTTEPLTNVHGTN